MRRYDIDIGIYGFKYWGILSGYSDKIGYNIASQLPQRGAKPGVANHCAYGAAAANYRRPLDMPLPPPVSSSNRCCSSACPSLVVMSLHSAASRMMGLPCDVVSLIDTYAACTSTPHHAAFAEKHGVQNAARLCACGPCFSDGSTSPLYSPWTSLRV